MVSSGDEEVIEDPGTLDNSERGVVGSCVSGALVSSMIESTSEEGVIFPFMTLDNGGIVMLTLAEALQRSHHSAVEEDGICENENLFFNTHSKM